jgi:hypothetical protein
MMYTALFRVWATTYANTTGARQQQIAQTLRAGIEDYLATH